MTTPPFSTLVLAAGKGTRMKSALPKVLHQACGRSLLSHVLGAATEAGAQNQCVVTGTGRELVQAEIARFGGGALSEAFQAEQKGTGHAVQVAMPSVRGELLVILCGDTPLLRAETIAAFVSAHASRRADLTVGVMEVENPFGYGRVLLSKGVPKAIVEEKEASDKQRKIRVVNGGLYVVSRKLLEQLLPKLTPSKRTGEIYLTDLVALAAKARKRTGAFSFPEEELRGVNDMAQLAEAEAILRARQAREWMLAGARLEAPGTLYADSGVVVEPGAVIGANVILKGRTRILGGAVVEANSVIKDSTVSEGASVLAFSHLDEAIVRRGARVGPYARLRPGTDVGENAHVGNFVELKKTRLGKGSKANHLTYLGDAEVGDGVNIGCGFIACNYDGVNKHVTTIESGAFVGSGVSAVAPVTIGKDAYVATGTVVNRDVPAGALAIARPKQENKEGYAERLRGRMQAAKKAGSKEKA